MNTKWKLDEYGCLVLPLSEDDNQCFLWIQSRPHYCDRGHWMMNVSGVSNIDSADLFPRYFMDLERAVLEAEQWVRWRFGKVRHQPANAAVIYPYIGREVNIPEHKGE